MKRLLISMLFMGLLVIACSNTVANNLDYDSQIVVVNKCSWHAYDFEKDKAEHSWPVVKRDQQGNLIISCAGGENDK